MKRTNKKGFTLVELVIVIAIIAILAAVLIPTFSGVVTNANKSKAMQAARNAYTEYLASVDYTAETVAQTSDFYIVVDDYAFYVDTNGNFVASVNTTASGTVKVLQNNALTDKTITIDATTQKATLS